MWLQRVTPESIQTTNRHRFPLFIIVFLLLLLILPFFLWVIDSLTVRTYLVLSFVWLLITSEVFVPTDPSAAWWDRLKWAKVAGWLVLAYIVFERVTEAIQ